MVQFFQMDPPINSAAQGAGSFFHGFNQTMGQGLNFMMQDMMQQKLQTREGKQFLEALGPDTLKAYGMDPARIDELAPLGQQTLSAIMQMKQEQSNAAQSAYGKSQLRNILSGGAGANQATGGLIEQLRPRPAQNILPPGTPPMLNAQNISQPGNIDLTNRPKVRNPDGSISTVRSKSFNIGGKEVLLPTISDEGQNLSDQDAVKQYRNTGRHLGIFETPEEANKYAQQLHNDQEALLNEQPVRKPYSLDERNQIIDDMYDKMEQGLNPSSKAYAQLEKDRKEEHATARSEIASRAQERRAQAAEGGLKLKQQIHKENLVKPYRESIQAKRDQVKADRKSLSLARQAINMGDTNSWTQFFANRYGMDPVKSSASQLLQLASKEFTIGSLKDISKKAQNQWIEQRFTSMFPSVGFKKDAQETAIAALERDADLIDKEVELYDHYNSKFIKHPEKISKFVDRDLKKYQAESEDKLSYEFSKIKDKYADTSELYSTDKPTNGEFITPEKAAAFTKMYNGDKLRAQNELLKLGYRMPTKTQLEKWRYRNFSDQQETANAR